MKIAALEKAPNLANACFCPQSSCWVPDMTKNLKQENNSYAVTSHSPPAFPREPEVWLKMLEASTWKLQEDMQVMGTGGEGLNPASIPI